MTEAFDIFVLIFLLALPMLLFIGVIFYSLEDVGMLNIFKKKYHYVSKSGDDYKIYLSRDNDMAVIKGNGVRKLILSPSRNKILEGIDEIESLKAALEGYAIRAEKEK